MATLAPRPITLTQTATAAYAGPAPRPLTVVGSLPVKAQVAALSPIANPATATATDVATAYNALLAALKA